MWDVFQKLHAAKSIAFHFYALLKRRCTCPQRLLEPARRQRTIRKVQIVACFFFLTSTQNCLCLHPFENDALFIENAGAATVKLLLSWDTLIITHCFPQWRGERRLGWQPPRPKNRQEVVRICLIGAARERLWKEARNPRSYRRSIKGNSCGVWSSRWKVVFAGCQSEYSSKVLLWKSKCVLATVTPHILNSEDSPSGEREEEEEEEKNHFCVHPESSFNSPFTTWLPLGCISDTESLFAGKVWVFPPGKTLKVQWGHAQVLTFSKRNRRKVWCVEKWWNPPTSLHSHYVHECLYPLSCCFWAEVEKVGKSFSCRSGLHKQ